MSLALKVLIVEDETPAAEKLERYLNKFNPAMEVIEKIGTVKEAVSWLQTNQSEIDLIFMDIQLHDGLSFQIFQQVDVQKPVIFITAYDEFALEAFKVNSIDYLLKPITFTDLSNSLKKLESLRSQLLWDQTKTEQIVKALTESPVKNFKTRFMVKLGDHIRSITTDQISFFYADGRDVYLVTNQLRKFIIDYTLEGWKKSWIIRFSTVSIALTSSTSALSRTLSFIPTAA